MQIFSERGNENYADEAVTQLQHALQCAQLAENEKASDEQIVAALLHDIGHLMADEDLPESLSEDLHDSHEERAYEWLKAHFGPQVADPVRLHVEAKRYLCSVDPGYKEILSPTSLKSFYDQGGEMNETEKANFEKEVYMKEALNLRKWDDLAKDVNTASPPLHYYLNRVEKLLVNA